MDIKKMNTGEILNFALKKCGNINFDVSFGTNNYTLYIYENFNAQRIYFANKILWEKSRFYMDKLYVECELEDSDLDNDYLSMTYFNKLILTNDKIKITKLPELPKSINQLQTNMNNDDLNKYIISSYWDWKMYIDTYKGIVKWYKK